MALLGRAKRAARRWLLEYGRPETIEYRGVLVPLSSTEYFESIRPSIYSGRYERREIDAAIAIIRAEDKVLEIGAGCGIVSACICRLLSSPRNLVMYEANPDLAPSIKTIMAVNNFDPDFRSGIVGTEDGCSEFYIAENFTSSSQFRYRENMKSKLVRKFAIGRVLDEIRPRVIIFDAQGAEVEILSTPLPDYVRAISGEFHPKIIGDKTVSDIVRDLLNQNFVLLLDNSSGPVLTFARR